MSAPLSISCPGCDVTVTPANSVPAVGRIIGASAEEYALSFRLDGMAMFAVCFRCWKVPTDRKRTLKFHFFSWDQAEYALSAAGSSNLG